MGLIKLSAGPGEIGQTFLWEWVVLVKSVCMREWDWPEFLRERVV